MLGVRIMSERLSAVLLVHVCFDCDLSYEVGVEFSTLSAQCSEFQLSEHFGSGLGMDGPEPVVKASPRQTLLMTAPSYPVFVCNIFLLLWWLFSSLFSLTKRGCHKVWKQTFLSSILPPFLSQERETDKERQN